jgi:hypothetical protein
MTAENADHIRRLVDWNADISVSIFDWSLLSAMRRRVPAVNGLRHGEKARAAGMPATIGLQATTDRSAAISWTK